MIWKILAGLLLALVLAFVVRLALFGSISRQMVGPQWTGGPLASCSEKPNCVSSFSDTEEHAIEPLASGADAAPAMQRVAEAIAAMPRTVIVRSEPNYLHAECTSALFRFVDDLELFLYREPDRDAAVLHVRSASRVGYSDLGANRRRVESLR